MKRIAILGSTGSIGTQALDVVLQHSAAFSVSVLTAQSNADLLIEQALQFQPSHVVIGDEQKYEFVKKALSGSSITIPNFASTTADDGLQIYSTGASAYRFFVSMNGTIYATTTTITAISDQRLKENIRDLDDGLDVVMALKPRKFDWKEGKGADIKNARGFIAQEFETVLPDMIEQWRDPVPEGEEPYKA